MEQDAIKKILKDKKLEINGIDIMLTDEQLQQFDSLVEKPKHKMGRPTLGQKYYVINYCGYSGCYPRESIWYNDIISIGYFKHGNCYVDEELVEQVIMDMNLTNKLMKFTYDNGWEDRMLFDLDRNKYSVFFNIRNGNWDIIISCDAVRPNGIYFKNLKTAEQAIKKIVIPFCKENPTYRFNMEGK